MVLQINESVMPSCVHFPMVLRELSLKHKRTYSMEELLIWCSRSWLSISPACRSETCSAGSLGASWMYSWSGMGSKSLGRDRPSVVQGMFLSAYLEAAVVSQPWNLMSRSLGSNFSKGWNQMALLLHQDQHQLVQCSKSAMPVICLTKCRVRSAVKSQQKTLQSWVPYHPSIQFLASSSPHLALPTPISIAATACRSGASCSTCLWRPDSMRAGGVGLHRIQLFSVRRHRKESSSIRRWFDRDGTIYRRFRRSSSSVSPILLFIPRAILLGFPLRFPYTASGDLTAGGLGSAGLGWSHARRPLQRCC